MGDRNFCFVNNLAYTEDSILVFNLFIYKISSKVTEADCKQYFTRFGEIVRFRFNNKPAGYRGTYRTAFVNFKSPEAAANVLKKPFHSISSGKAFSVKACDSWHQPQKSKYNPTPINLGGNAKNDATNNTAINAINAQKTADCNAAAAINNVASSPIDESVNIFDLNEDCFLLILKYMPLKDQVSLARSHAYFEGLFKSYAKLYYKNITSEHLISMSLWNIRQFFILAGEYIEKFTFVEWLQNKDRERIANFVQHNCPNLQKIKLDTAKIRVQSLYKILTNKFHLTQLGFNCLSVNDNCIHAVKKLPTLEHLSITHCYNFTGRFLFMLPQLKTLRLAHCSNLQTSNLHKAICAMSNLIALDITGSDRINKSFFDALQFKKPNLEILLISCIDANYDSIALLPKLRCLGLYCDNGYALRTSVFTTLAEKHADQLESLQVVSRQSLNDEQCQMIAKLKGLKKLHIPCNAGINKSSLSAFCELENLIEIKLSGSVNLHNNSLLDLVRSCPKLKWVNVQNTPIDNQFAKKLLPIIKKEKRENGRLTFLVQGTEMNEILDMPEEYKTDEIKSVVEFIFDELCTLKNYDNLFDGFENDYNGPDAVPFFEAEHLVSDSDDQDDDDDDDDDSIDFAGLDELGFLFDIPIFQHMALREAFGMHYHDSDDDDDDNDDDVYLW